MVVERFTDFIMAYPRMSIFLIGLAISFLITFVNSLVMDKERMREIKARQKEIQAQIKEHQKAGNHEKVMELNKEMFSQAGEIFKSSMKPALITIVPIIVLFGFIRSAYATTPIASTWFWWYFLSAIVGSMIFRKLFRMP